MREVKDLELHNISVLWISWPRQVRWEYVTPGVTLVNTIKGIGHLDRKDFLQHAMERKSAMCSSSRPNRCLMLSTFFPKTFSIDTRKGCTAWWKSVNEDVSSAWLIKPPDKFAGLGFQFVDIQKIKTRILMSSAGAQIDFNKCTDLLANNNNNDPPGNTEDTWQYGDLHNLPPDNATWVQQYIVNPLLSKNKYKNSIRSYMLILSVKPPLLLFHEGMVYRSLVNYMDWSNDTTWANGDGASK
jgi:hypothetical protein